ncbi:hypothetical protein PM082_017650 [Marasmius tenuissimus]|nr:hypothetical protein PM082_017650 [Marasmius tenuissimus]
MEYAHVGGQTIVMSSTNTLSSDCHSERASSPCSVEDLFTDSGGNSGNPPVFSVGVQGESASLRGHGNATYDPMPCVLAPSQRSAPFTLSTLICLRGIPQAPEFSASPIPCVGDDGTASFPSPPKQSSTTMSNSAGTTEESGCAAKPFIDLSDGLEVTAFYGCYESQRVHPLQMGQAYASSETPSSLIIGECPPTISTDYFCHRQVGSPTVTRAATARRGPSAPRYFCNLPGCSSEGFTSKTNLEYHIRAHNGERPFDCARCRHTFRSRSDLQRHMKHRKKPCKRSDQEMFC